MADFIAKAIQFATPSQSSNHYIKYSFLDHINSIDQCSKFSRNDSRTDGSMPFLDILVIPMQDGSLSITVYRKLTHTDLYLQWDSHHTISSKYSMVGTLHHRDSTICSSPQLLQEEEHLHKVLTRCNYQAWAFNRVKLKTKAPVQNNNKRGTINSGNSAKTTRILIWLFLIPEG